MFFLIFWSVSFLFSATCGIHWWLRQWRRFWLDVLSARTKTLLCSNHFRFAIVAIVQLCMCCKATVFKLCVRTEPGILLWNTVLLVVTTEISWFNKIRWIFVDTSGLGTGRTSSLLKLLLSPKIFCVPSGFTLEKKYCQTKTEDSSSCLQTEVILVLYFFLILWCQKSWM